MPLFGSIPADRNVEVDPVWVQPGAPSAPDSGELWWDTDEPAAGVTLLWHGAVPSLSVPANSTWVPYDFTLSLPRAGQVFLNVLVRYYMAATSAAYNVLYLNAGTAPGGPSPTGGYDEITTTGPYASAVQSGGMVPLMAMYGSVTAGNRPFRLQFQVASGSSYGFVIYTVVVAATLA